MKSRVIMIVEDDPYILRLCTMVLQDEGYLPELAATGREAMEKFEHVHPDVVLLDLGLPDIDGISLIRLFRSRGATPILVISARSEESEKIRALDCGADDYICKPFYTGELLARIRVAERRLQTTEVSAPTHIFTCDGLVVDDNKELVTLHGQAVHLTPIEYRLLRLLIQNRGKVLTHHFIQAQIWGSADSTDAKNLRVFMANLRRKIEGGNAPYRYILTQVGIGYRFSDK